MFITVNGTSYELKTTLGSAKALEKRFNMPISSIFGKIDSAEIGELIDILKTALVDKSEAAKVEEEILDNWDYADIQTAVQEVLASIMISGSDEEKERKLDRLVPDDNAKNALRAVLGLPTKDKLVDLSGGSA